MEDYRLHLLYRPAVKREEVLEKCTEFTLYVFFRFSVSYNSSLSQVSVFASKRIKGWIERANPRLPGGSVVKTPSANAVDIVLIPSPGRPHMLQSN